MLKPSPCRLLPLCLTALACLAVAGCPPRRQDSPPAKLTRFKSAEEMLEYVRERIREQSRSREQIHWWDWWGAIFTFGIGVAPAPPGAAEDSGQPARAPETGAEPAEQTYSTTNIQEAGVDESDVIKSDGTHLYVARGRTLRIVRAAPPESLAELAAIELGVCADELYLYRDRAIILAQDSAASGNEIPDAGSSNWPPYVASRRLTIIGVDVSDPGDPQVTDRIELDGSLVSSRLTNGRLILVLTVMPDVPVEPTPEELAELTLAEVLPKRRVSGAVRELVGWEDCYHPLQPDGCGLTMVVTLDAEDVAEQLAAVAVIAEAGTIYASPHALYVTDRDFGADGLPREVTAIHKFAFDEEGVAEYVASGTVPGRLLNQFSLGEHEGYLRVATEVSNPIVFDPRPLIGAPSVDIADEPSQFSAVYVLAQDGETLQIVGAVDGIAPDETLHSARFVRDHGFLVTYRKVDPLFILDLSDPTDPQVVGELKVPGFSDYLHPFGPDRLIGVGKYTVPIGGGFDWFQGVQISLFDVSDWSNPRVIEQIELGGRGSESEVDHTHKGFTFMPEQGLLAIPMRLRTKEAEPFIYGELEFVGVVAFRVDPDSGFSELGRLDLEGLATREQPETCGWRNWMRAAVIGQTLYGVCPNGIVAGPLADLNQVSTLELTE